MGYIPKKLALPKDHFWHYSISIDNTANEPEFALLILARLVFSAFSAPPSATPRETVLGIGRITFTNQANIF
jgi:hypothetical protein